MQQRMQVEYLWLQPLGRPNRPVIQELVEYLRWQPRGRPNRLAMQTVSVADGAASIAYPATAGKRERSTSMSIAQALAPVERWEQHERKASVSASASGAPRAA